MGLWVGLRDVESLPIIFPPIFSHLDKFNKPALSASSLPGVVAMGVTKREKADCPGGSDRMKLLK